MRPLLQVSSHQGVLILRSAPTLQVSRERQPRSYQSLIHCSLAKHITDCAITPPHHVNKTDWDAAVAGRILRLQITRPGVQSAWEFIGVYQHVAKSANRTARSLLRETLGAALQVAKQENKRVMLIGDFNAAPIDGRWGYAKCSCAAKEDSAMNGWVREACLIEIFHGTNPRLHGRHV